MRAAQITTPNHLTLIDLPIPTPQGSEVLIRVQASGICGTDVHIFRGEYLGSYPVIPGHEFAGVVEQVGPQVTRFKPGDRVAVEPNLACDNCINCLNNRQNFCLNWQAVGVTRPGGMEEFTLVPERAVFSIGEMPFEVGAFMEPLSCVLHGVERAQIRLNDRVAILGAGPIGMLLLQAVRLQGAARVTVVDRQFARVQTALKFGAEQTLLDLDELEHDAFDVVIDATGALPVISRSLDFARPGGTVLLFGVPPAGKKVEIEPFLIFRKGLKILSSYTSVRNSYQALGLLQSGQMRVQELISHRLSLAEFQHGIETIEQGREGVMKVMIFPGKA